MKTFFIVIFVAIFATPLYCFSQGTKAINKELENLSGQCAECSAYYKLAYHAKLSFKEAESAKSYKELEDKTLVYSFFLAKQRRDLEKAMEVTNARKEMYIKKMRLEVDNKNENISILINKYHIGCSKLVQNPPEILTTILQKEAPLLYLGLSLGK